MPIATKVPQDNAVGNRRAHRRAELRSRVALCSEYGPLSAVAFDVSPAGLGIESELPLAPGAMVSVTFGLPSGAVIEAQALVTRSTPPALGLKFHGLRQQERGELFAYCESWRKELLQRCSARTGFDRTPIAVVPGSTPADAIPRAAEVPVASAESAVRIPVSRIVDVGAA